MKRPIFFSLVLSLLVVGCHSDEQLTTTSKITYFEGPDAFAGMISTGYRDPASIVNHYPKYPKIIIF